MNPQQRRSAALLLVVLIATVVALVAQQVDAAPPGDNLTPRVTALESAVADLQARVSALEARTPSPSPSSSTGWTLAFDDQFTTWDPSRYFIYPSTWTNNYTGKYGTDITSNGQYARVHLYTDATGTPRIGAFCPIPAGSLSARGDLESMAVEFRVRADRMVGYKGVPLLWPMSGVWPRDGEIDGPESHFDQAPKAYMHRQDATSGGDQDVYSYPAGTSWQDWHVYRTEWIDGASAEFFIDGVSIGKSTSRVPNTPMHLVMQFETQLSMTKPDAAVNGYVEIDYLKVWSR